MHSEMGPLRQNPIQRTVRTAHLSVLMTVHNFSTQYTIQNSSDNLPSYLQTTIIAQIMSAGGEGPRWCGKSYVNVSAVISTPTDCTTRCSNLSRL